MNTDFMYCYFTMTYLCSPYYYDILLWVCCIHQSSAQLDLNYNATINNILTFVCIAGVLYLRALPPGSTLKDILYYYFTLISV